MKPSATEAARILLHSQLHGVLSTVSLDVPGYPFGSVTPYALDVDGVPVILISGLAQHTRNIQADHRVALTVFESGTADVQAGGRLTWMADARRITGEDTAHKQRYLRYVPTAGMQIGMADFAAYRLEPVRARYIGGFGVIGWVEPGALSGPNPMGAMEADVAAHMNADHAEALVAMVGHRTGRIPTEARMLGLWTEGFDIGFPGGRVWVGFAGPMSTPDALRDEMIRLTREARGPAPTVG